jgi:hypothetical protein
MPIMEIKTDMMGYSVRKPSLKACKKILALEKPQTIDSNTAA